MKILDVYKKNKTVFLFFILLLIIIIIVVGVIFYPSVFYDQWIWKYYWGPVVADATNSPSGVAYHNGVVASEGYTIVSEITYGIILVIALLFIYKLLKKLNIIVDWRFALSLTPYIVFGPVTRVLEDTGYFSEPFVYWFISPFLYFQIAAYALSFLVLGYFLEKKFQKPKITVNSVLFIGGAVLLVFPLYLIIKWFAGYMWGATTGVKVDVFLIVTSIVFLIVGLVYLIGFVFKNNEKIVVYKNPLNLAMITGHLLDGITSFVSIKDPLNMGLMYSEKHPASNVLLDVWGPLFPIVKFLLIIFVIFVFDILYKEELKNNLRLVNLLKIGILILGFSPGLRDLLRVAMGV
ncbi:MAG: DUF63 family protein [Candidatus Thermoplasmatota archaeon]|jgi:uncharacterized membrane protein|nr:DUF63 family protein [Candidatus Thermoplasmatota archaeon]